MDQQSEDGLAQLPEAHQSGEHPVPCCLPLFAPLRARGLGTRKEPSLLASCPRRVTLHKLLHLPKPQFPHLQNGDIKYLWRSLSVATVYNFRDFSFHSACSRGTVHVLVSVDGAIQVYATPVREQLLPNDCCYKYSEKFWVWGGGEGSLFLFIAHAPVTFQSFSDPDSYWCVVCKGKETTNAQLRSQTSPAQPASPRSLMQNQTTLDLAFYRPEFLC